MPHTLADIFPGGLDGLGIRRFTVPDLIEAVTVRRSRRIVLCPWRFGRGQFGAWIAAPDTDYLFFETDTAPVHQRHIILHELCHVLLGHRTVVIDDIESLSPEVLSRALQRSGDEPSAEDREAEALAAAIQQELLRRAGIEALTADVATAPQWRELVRELGIDA